MVFSSFIFLYLFLPLTVAVYFITPRTLRNGVLLSASVFFYAWGAPTLVIPLLISCSLDYVLSNYLSTNRKLAPQKRKLILALAITLNLSMLGYFKYANFFIEQLNTTLERLSLHPFSWVAVALPIGISFFTFQKISYLVDVYRGVTPVARNIFDYTLYVLLFPQLIAGPIVCYHDIAEQLTKRRETLPLFLSGVFRFCLGLGKKVLIADSMGSVADAVFALPDASLTTSWAWVGIVAYAYQIYFDFSGYSDMAIGLGAMFGLRFKENFNQPYISQTVTEFWRRWHISLTTFFREYLYFPLGGSRCSTIVTYRNLLLVFLLSGLWHGAAWTFILWGIFHGAFLILDRLFWLRLSRTIPAPVNTLITFIIILFGWSLFRAESLPEALHFMEILLGGTPSPYLPSPAGFIVDNRSSVIFLVATMLCFTPQFLPQARKQLLELRTELSIRRTLAYGGMSVVTLLLATTFLAARGHTPFLYFKF